MSKNLDEVTSEEGIYKIKKIINDSGYHNKMDVSHLLDYPNENNECLKIQNLEKKNLRLVSLKILLKIKLKMI